MLHAFDEEIGEVALQPGSGGNFIVKLNDQILFSRKDSGRFPEAKELKLLVRDAIGSGKLFGHKERS